MVKNLTTTELKKKLKRMDNEELIALVCEIFKQNNDAKHFLSAMFIGDDYIAGLLKDYKKKMDRMFSTDNDRWPSLTAVKKLITEFGKVADEVSTLDLMLYYVESGTEIINRFGYIDDSFENSFCNMFYKFGSRICALNQEEVFQLFKDRVDRVVEVATNSTCVYGDCIDEIAYNTFYTYDGEEDDDEELEENAEGNLCKVIPFRR